MQIRRVHVLQRDAKSESKKFLKKGSDGQFSVKIGKSFIVLIRENNLDGRLTLLTEERRFGESPGQKFKNTRATKRGIVIKFFNRGALWSRERTVAVSY